MDSSFRPPAVRTTLAQVWVRYTITTSTISARVVALGGRAESGADTRAFCWVDLPPCFCSRLFCPGFPLPLFLTSESSIKSGAQFHYTRKEGARNSFNHDSSTGMSVSDCRDTKNKKGASGQLEVQHPDRKKRAERRNKQFEKALENDSLWNSTSGSSENTSRTTKSNRESELDSAREKLRKMRGKPSQFPDGPTASTSSNSPFIALKVDDYSLTEVAFNASLSDIRRRGVQKMGTKRFSNNQRNRRSVVLEKMIVSANEDSLVAKPDAITDETPRSIRLSQTIANADHETNDAEVTPQNPISEHSAVRNLRKSTGIVPEIIEDFDEEPIPVQLSPETRPSPGRRNDRSGQNQLLGVEDVVPDLSRDISNLRSEVPVRRGRFQGAGKPSEQDQRGELSGTTKHTVSEQIPAAEKAGMNQKNNAERRGRKRLNESSESEEDDEGLPSAFRHAFNDRESRKNPTENMGDDKITSSNRREGPEKLQEAVFKRPAPCTKIPVSKTRNKKLRKESPCGSDVEFSEEEEEKEEEDRNAGKRKLRTKKPQASSKRAQLTTKGKETQDRHFEEAENEDPPVERELEAESRVSRVNHSNEKRNASSKPKASKAQVKKPGANRRGRNIVDEADDFDEPFHADDHDGTPPPYPLQESAKVAKKIGKIVEESRKSSTPSKIPVLAKKHPESASKRVSFAPEPESSLSPIRSASRSARRSNDDDVEGFSDSEDLTASRDYTYRPSEGPTTDETAGTTTAENTEALVHERKRLSIRNVNLNLTKRIENIKKSVPDEWIGTRIHFPDLDHPELRRSKRIRLHPLSALDRCFEPVGDGNGFFGGVRLVEDVVEKGYRRKTENESKKTKKKKPRAVDMDRINGVIDAHLPFEDEVEWPVAEIGTPHPEEHDISVDAGVFLMMAETKHSKRRLRDAADSYCVCPTVWKRIHGHLMYAAGAVYVRPGVTTKVFNPGQMEIFVLTRGAGEPVVHILKDSEEIFSGPIKCADVVSVPPGRKGGMMSRSGRMPEAVCDCGRKVLCETCHYEQPGFGTMTREEAEILAEIERNKVMSGYIRATRRILMLFSAMVVGTFWFVSGKCRAKEDCLPAARLLISYFHLPGFLQTCFNIALALGVAIWTTGLVDVGVHVAVLVARGVQWSVNAVRGAGDVEETVEINVYVNNEGAVVRTDSAEQPYQVTSNITYDEPGTTQVRSRESSSSNPDENLENPAGDNEDEGLADGSTNWLMCPNWICGEQPVANGEVIREEEQVGEKEAEDVEEAEVSVTKTEREADTSQVSQDAGYSSNSTSVAQDNVTSAAIVEAARSSTLKSTTSRPPTSSTTGTTSTPRRTPVKSRSSVELLAETLSSTFMSYVRKSGQAVHDALFWNGKSSRRSEDGEDDVVNEEDDVEEIVDETKSGVRQVEKDLSAALTAAGSSKSASIQTSRASEVKTTSWRVESSVQAIKSGTISRESPMNRRMENSKVQTPAQLGVGCGQTDVPLQPSVSVNIAVIGSSLPEATCSRRSSSRNTSALEISPCKFDSDNGNHHQTAETPKILIPRTKKAKQSSSPDEENPLHNKNKRSHSGACQAVNPRFLQEALRAQFHRLAETPCPLVTSYTPSPSPSIRASSTRDDSKLSCTSTEAQTSG
ncbi:unnamed protein product [Notodromas monacha]|uniref:Transmembrane protein n=1 Tax=Notodromas monacha TaxID=399045 RepID=A0A7R9BUF4_9CRUS|nr:unnamed protein product [Notodromas monacha]CAG0920944.1 unnamed protein product [Notodromas monacha]